MIRYERDPDGALYCAFPDGSTCKPGNPGCTISYCEDDAAEQATEDNQFAVRLATPNEES